MEDRRWIVSTPIIALVMISLASTLSSSENLNPAGRWVLEGSPDKSFSQFTGEVPYDWNNASLSWQRTAYHFQPKKSWMNDPCGPLYHMGWYHLFYQYNPESPLWGNITWGHAMSRDLIHWYHLPLAMVRNSPFDNNGVYTGSATYLPDGRIVMLYTGSTRRPGNKTQVQNLAYPANLSDPNLCDWVKYPGNPVLVSPPEIDPDDFRDPTTGWLGPDGIWRVAIGAKYKDNETCAFLVYKTTNFTSYFSKRVLHEIPDLGMWECVDFYPISNTGSIGLDTSAIGLGIKHVLKASVGINNMTQDYYALGTYDWQNDKWIPDNPDVGLGFGSKIDYGTYYASKTFYDPIKKRRILWGWILEADSKDDKINKGWASVQDSCNGFHVVAASDAFSHAVESIPRVVTFDQKTKTGILQWPVEEVETLRSGSTELEGVELEPDSVRLLDIGITADQLDITADFEIDKEALEDTGDDDATDDCSSGAVERGSFGPFGLIIADKTLSELTPIYFYIAKANNGSLKTFFCADKTRSSKASSVDKQVYGAEVPVLDGETLSVRLLVDHSVVESFAQGGRRVITLRNYPTEAVYGEARLFLFNNATRANVVASIKISKMESVSFQDGQCLATKA